MIEVIEGPLGQGKTLLAVWLIAERLSKGGHVYTNIDLKWPGLKNLVETVYRRRPLEKQVHVVERDGLAKFHRHVTGGVSSKVPVLVMLDEIHLKFNARDWQKTSRGLIEFLTQSRKVKLDITFISQDMQNVDTQFMRLAAFKWEMRNMTEVNILGFGWPIKEVLGLRRDIRTGIVNKRHRIPIKPLIYDAYNTDALLSELDVDDKEPHGLEELEVVSRAGAWKQAIANMGVVKYAAPAIAGGLALGRIIL